jgi:hypothetical protein
MIFKVGEKVKMKPNSSADWAHLQVYQKTVYTIDKIIIIPSGDLMLRFKGKTAYLWAGEFERVKSAGFLIED